jgi:tRNA(His) 5'-end guanylyltransferase
MERDSLGDRMKGYERASRMALPRRMPVILRVDGKGFHGVTRGCERPFDEHLMSLMNQIAIVLCEAVQGAVLGYVQSDEVSILVHNYKRLQSEAWFDNEVQKMASVGASLAASAFTSQWPQPVAFDGRVFVLPEAEVCNYFIWRQQDATRNSIQMATRAVYSHLQVNNKNTGEMQEMLHAKGINWNDYPTGCKRGRAVTRVAYEREGVTRHAWCVDGATPIFTQDRTYIESRLAVEPEDAPCTTSAQSEPRPIPAPPKEGT